MDKVIGGNITDRAILSYFKNDNKRIKRDEIIPFDSKNKYSITRVGDINLIKGAPEVLLKNCTNYYDTSGNIKKITNLIRLENLIKDKSTFTCYI